MASKNKPHLSRDGRSRNRPPIASQFKPGQSGNPKGRPKGSKNEATILHEILSRKIEIREGHKARKVQFLEALLLKLSEAALRGDRRAAEFLLNRYGLLNEMHWEPIRGVSKDMTPEEAARLYREELKKLPRP